ncbi:hypothetical protein [uncultured Dokdonia sp.]|uniref:hypothetical protein n=1 Tax=uncultured Dokdonia sp. TaxID=575653 RepID=UPI00260D4240|nr:hypothetical protein [uncultured Dokdonia sp.]
MSIKRLLLLTLLFFFQLKSNAQQQVSLEDFGLSFTLPAGWTGDIQGDYIVLGHTSIPGMMILSENSNRTIEAVVSMAQQGIQADGFNLTADGTFKTVSSKRAEGFYKGTYDYSTAVKAYAIGLIDGQGKGMSILVLTETNAFANDHINAANQLAKSVQFFTPKASPATLQWQNQLVGKKLTHRYTSGGAGGSSVTRIITLCANGTFTFYANTHANLDGPGGFGYANSNQDSRGNYTIYSIQNNSYLTLHFENGKESEYTLTRDENGYTFLESSRYAVMDTEDCD